MIEELDPLVRRTQELMLGGLDEAETAIFVRLLAKAAEAGNDLSRAPLRRVGER